MVEKVEYFVFWYIQNSVKVYAGYMEAICSVYVEYMLGICSIYGRYRKIIRRIGDGYVKTKLFVRLTTMGVTNSRTLMQQNSAEPREGNAAEFLRPFGSKRT